MTKTVIEYLYEICPDFNKTKDLTISDLQSFYKESKKKFDSDNDFKKRSRQQLVKLQKGDKDVIEAWNFIKDVSRNEYNKIYDRLNIKIDEFAESFYAPQIPALIKELSDKGLLEEDNGRLIIQNKKYTVPLTLIKSNGTYTYDTTDLAAIRYRLLDLKADDIYYVVGIEQSDHFNFIFDVAKIMGWLKSHNNVQHISFGLVLGEDNKKLKSRSGTTIKLKELLDEAIQRAGTVLKEKNHDLDINTKQDIIKKVAYSAVKYADLSTADRKKNYKFSYEKMLSFNGNTAPYLLYAYVRICALLRNASSYYDEAVDIINKNKKIIISNNYEAELSKSILLFPDIIEETNQTINIHSFCKYLYKLSDVFHKFFDNCKCLYYDQNKKIIKTDNNRLILCGITKKIMKRCFDILNFEVLEKM